MIKFWLAKELAECLVTVIIAVVFIIFIAISTRRK